MHKNILQKQGLWLEYSTLAWNIFGCYILLFLVKSDSVSIFGFGIDSAIEILASIVVIWQLKAVNKSKEKFAEKIIGVSFVILSLYILTQIYFSLTMKIIPQVSVTAIIWLLITALVMFLLAYGKSIVGKKLGNPVLISEAKVTVIDGLLAASVLIGLLLNAYFGLWWADSIASLIIVYYGIREALHTLR